MIIMGKKIFFWTLLIALFLVVILFFATDLLWPREHEKDDTIIVPERLLGNNYILEEISAIEDNKIKAGDYSIIIEPETKITIYRELRIPVIPESEDFLAKNSIYEEEEINLLDLKEGEIITVIPRQGEKIAGEFIAGEIIIFKERVIRDVVEEINKSTIITNLKYRVEVLENTEINKIAKLREVTNEDNKETILKNPPLEEVGSSFDEIKEGSIIIAYSDEDIPSRWRGREIFFTASKIIIIKP